MVAFGQVRPTFVLFSTCRKTNKHFSFNVCACESVMYVRNQTNERYFLLKCRKKKILSLSLSFLSEHECVGEAIVLDAGNDWLNDCTFYTCQE